MAETAIVPAESQELMRPVGDLSFVTADFVKQLEGRVELLKRMRIALLRLTRAEHWCDQGGKPYLESDGVHLLSCAMGVEFGVPKIELDDHSSQPSPWIGYRCVMTASLSGRVVSDMGYATTRDDFLASAGKGKGLLPLDQVDLGNIQKKAITNAQSRCFAKLSGFGSVTWAELKDAGIVVTRSVDYRGDSQQRGSGAGAWTQEKADLWAKLCEICGGQDAAAQSLEDMTRNPDRGFAGIRDLKQASDAQLKWLRPKIMAEWKKTQEGPEAADATRAPGQEG